MAKTERPLQIDIPSPAETKPIWSRVGIVAAIGFVVGIAWPRLTGVHIGPSAPSDSRPEVAASASASASASAEPTSEPAAAVSASASVAPEKPPSQDTVIVGPGKIERCFDKKGKKHGSCGELQIDPLVVPKLKELGKCASAIGLEGKMNVGFEVHFGRKEVHVTKGKKNTLPASTIKGVLQCAAKEMANLALDEVPHKFTRYTLAYQLTFVKPGTAVEDEKGDGKGDDEEAAGQTTSETGATGSAVVAWDTALLRKEPKAGEVIARLVRGTRVKLVGRQNDWYRVESGSKVGWVYRGSLGL